MVIITGKSQSEFACKFIIRIMTDGLKEMQRQEDLLTRKGIRWEFRGVRKKKKRRKGDGSNK